ncbi:MFS transporter [Sediminibacillus albus]|uniref:MFS transporter, PPP family, 3-phenylpropionic acid transporter n=1 Tax=Sediminibacillus albus TaxID=407036 RepID=A0A1G8WKB6_9BACI|nr:MFS transporter [Sediminibacillus albus]SDJ78040.1 MFS transporter, PPP family, 3-phenylpropionic acid transporter [Sediminibacillus albus]
MLKKESVLPLKSLLFCFHAANSIIITFLPIYLQDKDLDGTEIGYVLAIGPMTSLLAQPFWGYMSDKYRTVKRMILICLAGLLISSLIFFQMNMLASILLMGAVFYFFISPVGALSDSLAQRKSQQLSVDFGSIRTWGSIGFAVSSLLIGEMLARIGVQHMVWPYFLFGAASLLACITLTDVKVENTASAVQLADIKRLLQSAPFIIFLLLIMFLTVTHRANDSFLGIYIVQLGGSEGLVGLAWFAGVASEALVFALAATWFRKLHPLIFIIAAGLLYSSRWFIYAMVDEPVWVIAFQFMHGLSFGVFYLAAFQYVSRLIPASLQSTGHLLFVSVFFGLSGIIGSLFGGFIIDTMGGEMLYLVMAWIALFGSICITVYHILPYGKVIKVPDRQRSNEKS